MIIECKNCSKKFIVNEEDLPSSGRMVQCGNCSTQWLQKPTSTTTPESTATPESTTTPEITTKKENLATEIYLASDGKNYKFLGGQWGLVLPSGKSGRLAKKNIALELNKLAGRKVHKKPIKKKSKNLNEENEDFSAFQSKKSVGIFSSLIVLIMFVVAIILLLDTFKNQIIPFWPTLDNYLTYIFETSNNIYIITKDLFNNYK